jgi:hypothetical protein
MKTNTPSKLTPPQRKGKYTVVKEKVKCASRNEAVTLFRESKKRLQDINHWYDISGKGGVFKMTDAEGKIIEGLPDIGNLIRIELPAPGNHSGDGYDWVRIEEIIDDSTKNKEIYTFRVRPVTNPLERNLETSHFYTNDATSTFTVERKRNMVAAMEEGRNEVPNVQGSFFNKLRNMVVAISAMIGLSKPQWKALLKGILNINKTTKHRTLHRRAL